MPVVAADLLTPSGPLDPKMFPGEDETVLGERLDAYIGNGYNDTRVTAQPAEAQDALVRDFALYQAFRDVHIRMLVQPLQITVTEKGGHVYAMEQVTAMERLRDKYLADFEAELVIVPIVRAPAPITPGTRSVSTDVRWD